MSYGKMDSLQVGEGKTMPRVKLCFPIALPNQLTCEQLPLEAFQMGISP